MKFDCHKHTRSLDVCLVDVFQWRLKREFCAYGFGLRNEDSM